MKHGWLIHSYLLENKIVPNDIVQLFQQNNPSVPVVVTDIDIMNRQLRQRLPKNVDLWSSLGTIAFQRNIHNVRELQDVEHYAFFAPELHQYSLYQHMIPRSLILNRDGIVLPFAECFHRTGKSIKQVVGSEHVHIRPDNCLKLSEASQFALTDSNWEKWLSETQRHSGASPQSLFWLFPKQDIAEEYRFVIHNNCVVSQSTYPHDFRFPEKQASHVPQIAKNLAEDVATNIDISDSIYVFDIAKTTNDEYRVIELNCMATSGWYNMDGKPLIAALNKAILDVIDDLY